MLGLLLFDSMLFFGPSFSHLICYFGLFLSIQWLFLNKKRKFGTVNLGHANLG